MIAESIAETAAASVAETATVAEAAIAEAATVSESAIAEAIPETAITERGVEEATIAETTTAVAEAANAGEVDELGMGFTGRADDVSPFQIRSPRLDIETGRVGVYQRRLRHAGKRRAGEGDDTCGGHCPTSKGSQQGTARQFLVHGLYRLRSPPFPLKGKA
jgi:hypothetical protein